LELYVQKGHNSLVKLLVIDDDLRALELVSEALAQEGLQILTASHPEAGLELFSQKRPHIVLTDLMMPGMNGIEVLQRILMVDPTADVILMTANYSTDSAVEAIQKGACDYMTKPLSLEKLRSRVADLMSEAERQRKASELDEEMLATYQTDGIIGRNPLMLEVFSKIRRVAPHFRSVLITGATGTGKELAARALYRSSPVSAKPFAVCNCSSIVDTLFESELFGYVRGAFTGANQDKAGLFEFANGGVVFLDEIGELPLAAQAKLLRVLQNQEIQRVGSPVTKKVDVRVIAATNRDLKRMVLERQFREDLYYRLAMVEIKLPRLAERREDIPLLQRHFVDKFSRAYGKEISSITRRAQALLSRHDWPGNVREFENVIGSACMVAQGTVLDIDDFPEEMRTGKSAGYETFPSGFVDEDMLPLEVVEQRHVSRVLERVNGNKNRAAEILGISRSTLYTILEKTAIPAKI
jgi:DNA-binding NtrC family response regulator